MSKRKRGRQKRRSSGRKFYGGLVRGRIHPRVTSCSPWNSVVVTVNLAMTVNGLSCVNAGTIRTLIRRELGLLSANIDIRLVRVDVWVSPRYVRSDKNYIVFAPCDWTNKIACVTTQHSVLNWYQVWGTATEPAHAHYQWSKTLATNVITVGEKPAVIIFDVAGSKDHPVHFILKLHVQWRPNTPNPQIHVGVLTSMRLQSNYVHASEHPGVM